METIVGWFDLGATGSGITVAGEPDMPLLQQLLLYGIVVLGVLFSEIVAMARRGGPLRLQLDPVWVATACIIALVVFPAVWRDLEVSAQSSPLAQAGLAAQGGVFWGVLMAGAEKRVTGTAPDDPAGSDGGTVES
jgi:hypothetical protein